MTLEFKSRKAAPAEAPRKPAAPEREAAARASRARQESDAHPY